MDVNTRIFADALKIAAITIERRNTIPILSMAALNSAAPEAGSLYATNLDQGIKVTFPVLAASRVNGCINAPDAVSRLIMAGGSEIATIERNDHFEGFDIKSGQMAGRIAALPTVDMPTMNISGRTPIREGSADWVAQLPLSALDMIFRVFGACSREETRYYLNGVYFHHVEGWSYRAVCTDGHRLYYGTIEQPDAPEPMPGVIIPRHAIDILRRLRPRMQKDAPIEMAFGGSAPSNSVKTLAPDAPQASPSRIRFAMTIGDMAVDLISKSVDGTFPDYKRVIPAIAPGDHSIRFKSKDLLRALSGITAGMNERTRAVRLVFSPDGRLVVSAKWIEAGFEGKIEIDAHSPGRQKEFEIGFNAAYLRNLVQATGAEDLVINVADNAAPSSITDPDATDFAAVLMPMRV